MKRGFTLAEVLIALSIIGIIAALTLPGLRTNMGERKAAAWHSKYCNILDGAVKQAMFAHDLATASLVTYDFLVEQLHAVEADGGYQMKDGTLIESLDSNEIIIKFNDDNMDKRKYTIVDDFEGVDCRTNGDPA